MLNSLGWIVPFYGVFFTEGQCIPANGTGDYCLSYREYRVFQQEMPPTSLFAGTSSIVSIPFWLKR